MGNYQSAFTGAQHDAYVTKEALINLIYPIGSIYISTNSTSPATLFGGSWSQIQGQFLLASSSTYAAGSTGGEATHTLTQSEMPKHWHNFARQQWFNVDETTTNVGSVYSWKTTTGGSTSTGYVWSTSMTDAARGVVGGNAAHNNMPPYLSVYMWKRTA